MRTSHYHWCGHCRRYVTELRNVRPWPDLDLEIGECPTPGCSQTIAWAPDVTSAARDARVALTGDAALEPHYSTERALRDSEVPS